MEEAIGRQSVSKVSAPNLANEWRGLAGLGTKSAFELIIPCTTTKTTNWSEQSEVARPSQAGFKSHLQLGIHPYSSRYLGGTCISSVRAHQRIPAERYPTPKHRRPAPQRVKFNDRRDLNPILRHVNTIAKPRCLGQDLQQRGI